MIQATQDLLVIFIYVPICVTTETVVTRESLTFNLFKSKITTFFYLILEYCISDLNFGKGLVARKINLILRLFHILYDRYALYCSCADSRYALYYSCADSMY